MNNKPDLLYLSFPILNKLLVNSLPVNIFIVDKGGYLVWGNPRMIKTLNENLDSFVGQHVSKWGEDRWEACQETLEKGCEQIVEEIGIDRHVYLTSRIPVKELGENDVQGIIGISLDITTQKQAERAKQSFLQNMAHDIRTPLTGIIGLAHLQRMGLDSLQQAKEYGEMIHGAGNQLLELLNAVLKTVDTKHMTDPVKAEPLDLSGLAKELHALMAPSVYTKGLEFPLALDPKLPLVLSDRIKLKRVLINLLSNAVKFTKEGAISLSIKLLSTEDGYANIEIKVSDTGIGMAEDKLDKIFDRFYRVHPSHSEEYKGYGLGLYLVKESLELLGGEIQVTSAEGKGTCFILQFKFSLAHKQPDKIEPVLPSVSEGTSKPGSGTVLITEDNFIARYTLEHLLRKAGYEISSTVDGESALDALKNETFAWALLDIGLPGLEGNEVCRQYRQWEKANNKPYVPIFILTGHGVEEVEKECKDAGIDRVFTKPLTDEIIQDIEGFMKAD